jgi:hypothetical protein
MNVKFWLNSNVKMLKSEDFGTESAIMKSENTWNLSSGCFGK